MAWTTEDELKFQERLRDHHKELDEEDKRNEREAILGLRKRCPSCGSHRYLESTYTECCSDCGLSESYY